MENKLQIKTLYFTYGNEGGNNIAYTEESDETYAKQVINETTGTSRYFVKRSPEGFANPLAEDDRKKLYYKRHAMYNWISVKEAGFELYLQFLRTGKKQFLHQAERLF